MIKLRIDRDWGSRDGWNIWVIDHRGDNAFVANPIELKFSEMGSNAFMLPEPTFRAGGAAGLELLQELRRAIAGFEYFQDKEDFDASKRIEKAMQDHIDSLKLVVERTLK